VKGAGEWCAAHDAEIRRLAGGLLRRWSVPAAVTADDVAQELRLGAVLALAAHDPSRGVPRDRFVWWQAVQRAKRWLHVQRGALRRSGSAPSEHPMGEAAAGVDVDQREGRAPRADDVAAFYEMLCLALAACRTSQERACFDVLLDARLDVDVASVALFTAPTSGARTPREARRMVRECVQRITEVQVWRQ
jgi:hypothetical protein